MSTLRSQPKCRLLPNGQLPLVSPPRVSVRLATHRCCWLGAHVNFAFLPLKGGCLVGFKVSSKRYLMSTATTTGTKSESLYLLRFFPLHFFPPLFLRLLLSPLKQTSSGPTYVDMGRRMMAAGEGGGKKERGDQKKKRKKEKAQHLHKIEEKWKILLGVKDDCWHHTHYVHPLKKNLLHT